MVAILDLPSWFLDPSETSENHQSCSNKKQTLFKMGDVKIKLRLLQES